MTFVSHAQNGEDVLLRRALRDVERGFWIDVGAADPDEMSVTRAFHDRGWTGVNIEPGVHYFDRLRARRPTEINLQVALGAAPGTRPFHVLPGTGLSTLDPAIAAHHRHAGFAVEHVTVEIRTLAEICRWHAPPAIHFLKIDVEGAEAEVLAGADFVRYRPWIVLVEATRPLTDEPSEAGWEADLLACGYGFVWFDGLNRFYVADEHRAARAHAFGAPPNPLDDYVLAEHRERLAALEAARLESEIASRAQARAIAERDHWRAEAAATTLAAQEAARTRDASALERGWLRHSLDAAQIAAHETAIVRGEAEAALWRRAVEAEAQAARLQTRIDEAAAAQAHAIAIAAPAPQAHSMATGRPTGLAGPARLILAAAYRMSLRPLIRPLAWRLRTFMVGDLRVAIEALRTGNGASPAALALAVPATPGQAAPDSGSGPIAELATVPPMLALAAPLAEATPAPVMNPPVVSSHPRRAVHQFHPGSASGDAISNAMLLTRDLLRAAGFASEIYVESRDLAHAAEMRLLADIPLHDDYVLIVRHSLGYPGAARIIALPAPKLLMYHNITPARLLGDDPAIAAMATLGREQLALWKAHCRAAVADSAFNAIELVRAGFPVVRVCQTLVDVERLRMRAARAAANRTDDATGDDSSVLTILFVGRISGSKGQANLVDAYAAFRERYRKRARLVLVGRVFAGSVYREEITRRIRRHDLAAEIVLTGAVDDATLDGWYAQADIYASMSLHEGFGVPLLEAMAHGVPIAALAAGAVPGTVGEAALLVTANGPDAMAEALLSLATDELKRATLRRAARHVLDGFALPAQARILVEALGIAGAVPQPSIDAALLASAMHVTVAGHVNGSYSLASVNRDLATALADVAPGRVGVLPVEGAPFAALFDVPAALWAPIEALVGRAGTGGGGGTGDPTGDWRGPRVLVSQHYPVWAPDPDDGTGPFDLAVAYFFWEESLVPAATIAALNARFDAVLAPSTIVADALVASGLTVPLRIVGHAPMLARFQALADRPERQGDRAFTLLHVSSGFPRKGVDLLLAAYARAFGPRDRVRLVIKTFPNPHNTVAADIAAWRERAPDLCEIIHIDADLTEDALSDLYLGADAMVLPTRGEGFNIPAAEAAACGIPLIVSAVGGHTDFIAPDEAFLVDGRHVPAASHLAQPGSLWFEPDIDALIAAMRHVVDDRRSARARAVRARVNVPDRLDHAVFARRLLGTLAELLISGRTPPARRMAVVTSWAVRCGIAEYTAMLLDAMPDLPARVRILADTRTAPHSTGAGLEVDPCWVQGEAFDAAGLARVVAAEDPELLLIEHHPGLIPWAGLAALLSDPVLGARASAVTLHNTRELDTLDPDMRARVVAGLAAAGRVIVHGADDLDRLRRLGLRRIAVIDQGAPVPGHAAPVARVLAAHDAPIIGTYGFLLSPKGFGMLIEALRIVRQDWPAARLRMVTAIYDEGPSEVEHHKLLALAHRTGVADAIEWHTGFLPTGTSLDLLRGCDLLVLPYRATREASSAALRTALAAQVPTATTPIEIFREAEGAVATLPGDTPDLIAAGIATLLRDTQTRRDLAARQAAWLDARSWPRIASRTRGLLEALHVAGRMRAAAPQIPGSSLTETTRHARA